MNAERLHALALAVRSELNEQKVDARLEKLLQSLDQVINNPHPQHQQELATAIEQFYKAFSDSVTDRFSPAWRQLLDEIGGTPYVGEELRTTVQAVFERNQITPAVALSELRSLQKKLKAFLKGLDNLANGFETLNIGDEKLEPGECEVGMLIPRQEIHNRLPEFADELKELTFIVQTFSEVTTGKPDDLSIKTISSSDLMVVLKATVTVCAAFAKAVEKVVGLYKSLLDLKKIKEEMAKHGVPNNVIAGVEAHANTQMTAGIEQISIEIVQENYTQNDPGRRNELITRTKVSLSKVAERIDRGFNIEVRAEPLAKGQEDKENISVKIQMIQTAARNIQFLKPGGPPILRLEDAKPAPQQGSSPSVVPPSLTPDTSGRAFDFTEEP